MFYDNHIPLTGLVGCAQFMEFSKRLPGCRNKTVFSVCVTICVQIAKLHNYFGNRTNGHAIAMTMQRLLYLFTM